MVEHASPKGLMIIIASVPKISMVLIVKRNCLVIKPFARIMEHAIMLVLLTNVDVSLAGLVMTAVRTARVNLVFVRMVDIVLKKNMAPTNVNV